ncbi:hypothetical protein GCM10007962_25640 [Yeosuana aromativorans]|uniref:DUF1343 domain-containing protein n=2 Tax=Yeosuana aromativorans TaxID=288019 RepID=A0A8J3BR19_9FLAO|nr:hypothetical protein GCM10007962_25640 [Yeosuana aromativorans]
MFLFSTFAGCHKKNKNQQEEHLTFQNEKEKIVVGANQTEKYLNLINGKNIAIVANNTSVIFKDSQDHPYKHLIDSLLSINIKIKRLFTPEHGLRGAVDAGEEINNGIDEKTGIPIVSLYGDNNNHGNGNKPSKEQLKDIDLILFDIQDVGVRFYTYLSTLHYIMEAAAENGIPVIVLDRPNPNGNYIDGPVLQSEFKSFVGLHPVPIVYGMTIGEYAKMINGEKWLNNGVQCDLTVIPLKNYTHESSYSLPLRPSPNLPNDKSINLYPSLCLFEGTNVSCGRGTEMQFQIFGSPDLPSDLYKFTFTPQPNFGSKKPKNMGQECHGLDLSKTKNLNSINFSWLIDAYHNTSEKNKFFREKSFNLLAGTDKLKEQIEDGLNFNDIKASWQKDLDSFKKIRQKYLLYP